MVRHTEPTLEQGLQIGPYHVDQLEVTTRFSRIARATHVETGDSVALKLPAGPNSQRVLQNELVIYRCLAGIESSRIVRMHGSGIWRDAPYIATEWQQNGTLREVLPMPLGIAKQNKRTSQPSNPQVFWDNLRIVADGAAGLAELHEQGFIHCDVKPDNIAIGDNNTGKLLDFGVALSADDAPYAIESGVFGTPGQSIPPEAYLDGNTTSPTRDAWAMAATAFRALSGVMVFGEPRSLDPIGYRSQVNRRPPLALRDLHPSAPSDLDRIITEALDPDPKKRPSVSEMRDVFNQAANQDRVSDH